MTYCEFEHNSCYMRCMFGPPAIIFSFEYRNNSGLHNSKHRRSKWTSKIDLNSGICTFLLWRLQQMHITV